MYNIFNVRNNDLKTVSGRSFSVSFINFEQTNRISVRMFLFGRACSIQV